MSAFNKQDPIVLQVVRDALEAADIPFVESNAEDLFYLLEVAKYNMGTKYDIRFMVVAGMLIYEIANIFTIVDDDEERALVLLNINALNDQDRCDFYDSGLVLLEDTGIAIRYVLNYRDHELMRNIPRLIKETESYADYVYDFLK